MTLEIGFFLIEHAQQGLLEMQGQRWHLREVGCNCVVDLSASTHKVRAKRIDACTRGHITAITIISTPWTDERGPKILVDSLITVSVLLPGGALAQRGVQGSLQRSSRQPPRRRELLRTPASVESRACSHIRRAITTGRMFRMIVITVWEQRFWRPLSRW